MEKDYILAEIRRTAEVNGGTALGRERFQAATGIKPTDWVGKHWVRWSQALAEAGFPPNQLTAPYDEDFLLAKLASLVRELGRFPVPAEVMMRHKNDKSFPNEKTFRGRFGRKEALVARLLKYCQDREGLADVAAICEGVVAVRFRWDLTAAKPKPETEVGYVYLVRMNKWYKIGKTNHVGRRQYELRLQLPERETFVHAIKAFDDPDGIEAYWHRRFEKKKTNKDGEWFALTPEDVRAFRRRTWM